MSLTGLFFVISGIQYWASHYLQNVLGVNKSDTFKYFLATCITSPVLGAVLSGHVARAAGGYQNKWPLIYAFIAGLIAVAAAIPMPFIDDPIIAIGLVWIVLFTGAFILPIMTGVMLTVVEQEYKPQANSMANMSYNLFGYLPAPTIYGLMNSDAQSRAGMTFILYASIPAVALIGVAHLLRKIKKSSKSSPRDDLEQKGPPMRRPYNNVSLGPEPSLIGVGITENFQGNSMSDVDTKTALGLQYARKNSKISHHSGNSSLHSRMKKTRSEIHSG